MQQILGAQRRVCWNFCGLKGEYAGTFVGSGGGAYAGTILGLGGGYAGTFVGLGGGMPETLGA